MYDLTKASFGKFPSLNGIIVLPYANHINEMFQKNFPSLVIEVVQRFVASLCSFGTGTN